MPQGRNLPVKKKLIVVVVCLNIDGFHGQDEDTFLPRIFIQYLIWEGIYGKTRWLDEPTFQDCCDIINMFPDREVKCVERTCRYCRAKGVK